jgi:hypothetical protein
MILKMCSFDIHSLKKDSNVNKIIEYKKEKEIGKKEKEKEKTGRKGEKRRKK